MTAIATVRIEKITAALAALAPSQLEVIDDSARHVGHAGAKTGLGHFNLVIASPLFAGLTPLAAHRVIYAALGELMHTDIHALSIKIQPAPIQSQSN
jgi:BolA family transcriptional regulator, general stress-responsive regulator